jgi:hypothetical protein
MTPSISIPRCYNLKEKIESNLSFFHGSKQDLIFFRVIIVLKNLYSDFVLRQSDLIQKN